VSIRRWSVRCVSEGRPETGPGCQTGVHCQTTGGLTARHSRRCCPARRRTVYWPFALVVTRLTRRSGGPDIAEDAAAEAFATAVQGPAGGITQPQRQADHHSQPQGHRPDPAREQVLTASRTTQEGQSIESANVRGTSSSALGRSRASGSRPWIQVAARDCADPDWAGRRSASRHFGHQHGLRTRRAAVPASARRLAARRSWPQARHPARFGPCGDAPSGRTLTPPGFTSWATTNRRRLSCCTTTTGIEPLQLSRATPRSSIWAGM
jgi:hypothetical protein